MKYSVRELHDFEIQFLRKRESELVVEEEKFKWGRIIILFVITIVSAIHIYYFDQSRWSLISKLTVVVSPIIIWVLIENHWKKRRKKKNSLLLIKEILKIGAVEIIIIRPKKVAFMPEFEDEGDLYLIEIDNQKCIYLWDYHAEIITKGKNISEIIEVYLNAEIREIFNTKIRSEGPSIEFVKLEAQRKWNYFSVYGFPEDFGYESKAFEEKVREIQEFE